MTFLNGSTLDIGASTNVDDATVPVKSNRVGPS